jgi:hypothetical protein
MSNYSHSMLSLYRSCPLKFRYRYEEHLTPLQPPSRHDMDYGNAIHKALAVLYAEDGSIKAAQAEFARAYPADRFPDPLPLWSQGKTFDNGLAVIRGYAKRWHEEDRHWKILHIEDYVKEEGEDARSVRLDLIVQDLRDEQVWAIDHKVTGQYLDTNYFSRFEPDSQIRTYVDHVKKRFGHCGGFIINAITCKHRSKAYTPRQGPNKGVQQPAGDWYDFGRVAYNPNSECLQLETDNTTYWVARIKQDRESGQWGYNTEQCHRGGVECEYLKLCAAGYSLPDDEELIFSYYRRQCARVLEAGRCLLDEGHEGWCDPVDRTDRTTDYSVVPDEEAELEDAVSD